MADHLFDAGIGGMAYQQEPDSTIWVYTVTGGLVAFTYDREQKIVGLTSCPIEDGLVRGITSIPTFLVIKKGEVVHQIVGSQPYEKFKQTVLSKI